MKLLTLNTHSMLEENYEEKLGFFLEFILREGVDIIALQEVNQSADARIALDSCGMVPLEGTDVPLREDNHALRIARMLRAAGSEASWAYLPVKRGYGRYDEGMAVMCLRGGISATDRCTISGIKDYQNWRTRAVLGVRPAGCPEWFYSVHMGWWQDEQEPFAGQWKALERHLAGKKRAGRVWLMGDFNAPAELRGQGYDLIAGSGWRDGWLLAGNRDAGCTVRGAIDGWRGLLDGVDEAQGMRIDHIWVSQAVDTARCSVVFDGRHGRVVSDHFGVMLETKGGG
ncbi:MAG: endonuclease/exonuclease/phosphatase family protein [Clostridia bacterium]|nr:endonuclease/exonuclease/phosphatase family protein [Clostridia bacterium]